MIFHVAGQHSYYLANRFTLDEALEDVRAAGHRWINFDRMPGLGFFFKVMNQAGK